MAKKNDNSGEQQTIASSDVGSVDEVLGGDLTETEASETTTNSSDPATVTVKRKKMSKEVDYEAGCVRIEVVGGDLGMMTFNMSELPEDIVAKLAPFGLGHKLGDAGAGTSGIEAEAAISKVWEGMTKGEWTIRQPAAPKIDRKAISEKMNNMSPEDQEKARALLASLGIGL